jgi:hypothetical protein
MRTAATRLPPRRASRSFRTLGTFPRKPWSLERANTTLADLAVSKRLLCHGYASRNFCAMNAPTSAAGTILFPNRIGRLSYLSRFVVFSLITWPLCKLYDDSASGTSVLRTLGLIGLALVLIAYWLWYLVRPRAIDAGLSPWSVLLAFLPLINIGYGLYLLLSRTKPSAVTG